MTTNNDDLNDRVLTFGPVIVEQGREQNLYADPSGIYPAFGTWGLPTTPFLSYGVQTSELSIGGGVSNLPLSIGEVIPSMQNRNRVTVTPGGHSIELDDTPGNERVLLRHNSGRGIEIRPDGAMIISSGRQIISVNADQTVVIEGDANIVYGGNVNMSVAGNFNVSVGGNYNVSVAGNKGENVEGSSRYTTEGNWGSIVKGNHSQTNLGTSTTTNLGNMNNITKGAVKINSEGDMQVSSGANGHISSKSNMFISSDNMNVAANDLSVFGATGTIGGQGIVYYGKGATFSEGVTAPTFHGDLDGLAKESSTTYSQQYADPDPGGGVGSDNWSSAGTDTETPTTAQPTSAMLDTYLNRTSLGAIDVKVDIGNFIRNSLSRSDATGGLSTKDLSTSEIRALLRTEGNRENSAFITTAIASGQLSPTYTRTTPGEIGRISSVAPEPYHGVTELGTPTPNSETARFVAPDTNVPTVFNPSNRISDEMNITMTTILTAGIAVAAYSGGAGQTARLDILPQSQLPQIARNLQPNAEILKRIRSDTDADFRNYRMMVIEGLYNPPPPELESPSWATSTNKKKYEGRAAVYELHDRDGISDIGKTFDLAVKLKTVALFEKIILDYDTYDPSGQLNAQIIVEMPKLSEEYKVIEGNFGKAVETRYNGSVISSTDLVEVNAEGEIVTPAEDDLAAAATGTRTVTEASNVDARIDSLPINESVRDQIRSDLASLPGYTAVVYQGDIYYVTQDYYNGPIPSGLGNNGAVSLDGARAIADANGAILPSEGLVREIHRSADVQIVAQPDFDRYGESDAGVQRYNEAVSRQLSGANVETGQLVSGYAKDFTSTGGFLGLWQSNGTAIQGTNRETPFTNVHSTNYYDYSQRVRLVRPLGRDATTGAIVDFR
jgi:hypothetical protein